MAVILNHSFKSGFHIHSYRLSVGGEVLLGSVSLIIFVISIGEDILFGSVGLRVFVLSVGPILPTESVDEVPERLSESRDLSTLLWITDEATTPVAKILSPETIPFLT